MKRSISTAVFVVAAFVMTVAAEAGVIVPTGMKLLTNDLTGQLSAVRDRQGRQCALVKVKVPFKGAKFDGDIRQENATGEYNVFVEDGNKYLKMFFPNCEPVMINFVTLMGKAVQAPLTYELTIDIDALGYDPASEGVQPVSFSVNPVPDVNVFVEVDRQKSIFSESGEARVLLLPGEYVYKVTAEGYETVSGRVKVESDANNSVNVLLRERGQLQAMRITVNDEIITLVPVRGGTFSMGSEDAQAFSRERPVHGVSVTGFYMADSEVTQGLWRKVMGSNPAQNAVGDNYPVENVSWEDCQEFIKRLNSLSGRNFRLPTEAEWEYAARGGSYANNYRYSGSDILDRVAWYTDNSGSGTHSVRTKLPNELGLYDMSGNVWEWVADIYSSGFYRKSPVDNPVNETTGNNRVYRGGGWNSDARDSRVTCRHDFAPTLRHATIGMRLLLPIVPPEPEPMPEPEPEPEL